MRKIYQKYFEIPEEGKGIMGEHVFFARLTVAITCIVLCMSAMGFSAYAFFTVSVSSNMNHIQAANYSLSVQSIEIVPENESGSVVADSSNPIKYKLQKGMYDFVLMKEGNANTGYCKIKINNNENDVIVTRQIEDVALTVRIEVAQETEVEFVACWGTYHISEEERFRELEQMIIVDGDNKVIIEEVSDIRTVSSTATAPIAISEPITTTKSEPMSTQSETQGITPTEEVTPKESTTTSEGAEMETEEEKIEYSQENY